MEYVGQQISDSSNEKNLSERAPEIKKESSRTLILYTVLALGVALFVRFFIASPYVVSGASMDPTFHDWHYLIVERVSYELGDPMRGDVVVFDLPGNTGKSLIKRIIGVPGDTVVVKGNSVTILNASHPEGFALEEPYLDPENFGGVSDLRVTLGEDQFFVLGDNRGVSSDSRIWGTLPRENIVGRAFLRLYPFTELDVHPGEARYAE